MAAHSTPRGALGMLFAVILLLQSVVVAQHHHGYAHTHPAHRSVEAMNDHLQETERSILEARANNIQIRGATDGRQYPRLEIRQLQANRDQWNLYLLAMERFKAKPRNDRMSYYQIAGEHLPLPYKSSANPFRCPWTSVHELEQPGCSTQLCRILPAR